MVVIDKEFESLIPPLSPEEFAQLEENCVKEGIRDALVVWPQEDGSDILIDGHNRWKIANKHQELFVNYKRMQFEDRDEARVWIANNQLGRRNLHPLDQERLLSVKREALAKQARERQGTRTDLNIVEKFPQSKTRDIIGKEIGVSGRQVDKLHEINEKATEKTKQLVREGKLSINQAYNSVHEKKPSATKQAKEEHEEFEKTKGEKTISFQDMQTDKLNQEIISDALFTETQKLLNAIEKYGFQHSVDEIRTLSVKVPEDERSIYADTCEKCQLIIEKIKQALTGGFNEKH